MRDHYKDDPYRTRARFRSVCFYCNETIRKGEKIIVWPRSKKGSKAGHYRCSEADYRKFEAAAYDEYVLNRR